MRRLRKGIFSVLAITALAMGLTSGQVLLAEEQDDVQLIEYEEVEVEGENYGHISINYRIPNSDPMTIIGEGPTLNGGNEIPSAYDSRTYGYVTEAKDQGNYGTCWAFAAISCAESDAIIDGRADINVDYSELQMAYYTYNKVADPLGGTAGDEIILGVDDFLDIGGNLYYSTMSLASWVAPIDEELMDYSNASTYRNSATVDDTYAYNYTERHLQNSYWIPMSDTASIKSMIMKYGCVDSSLLYSAYYIIEGTGSNSDERYFYNPDSYGQNHEITLVGWDDNMSASNFAVTIGGTTYIPENNGAWLVKNSHGKENYYNNDGYFWVSYEDLGLNYCYDMAYDEIYDNVAAVFDFEDADNYDYNYQYDGSYALLELGSYGDTMYGSNVFTVENGTQTLDAVGFYTTVENMDYSIQIYKVTHDGTPLGEPLLTNPVQGTKAYAGYHTVKLNEKVVLEDGDKFSVVVKYTTPANYDDGVSMFVDYSVPDSYMSFVSYGELGQSYHSDDGINWSDMYSEYEAILRIKAFTSEIPVENVSIEEESFDMGVGDELQMLADITPANATNQKLIWTSSNTDVATIDNNGLVKAIGVGQTTITVTSDENGKNDSCVITVKQKRETPSKPILVSRTENSITVQYDEKYVYSLDCINWQDSGVFENLKDGTVYSIYVLEPGDEYYYQSDVSEALVVSTYSTIDYVTLDYTDIALVLNDETFKAAQLTAIVGPSGVRSDTVSWSSENEKIATVDENGLVTAVSMGETNIVATADGDNQVSATCKVAVYKRQATPNAPTCASKTCNTVTLSKVSGAVYSKDGKNWQSSNVFTGLNPETTYTFYVKMAENGYYMESESSSGLKVTTAEAPSINVSYRTHIQTFGWEGDEDNIKTWKSNGAMSGTSGLAKRLEGINIVVAPTTTSEDLDLGIQYTTHCQSYGWLPWSADGDMNGTEGEAKRLEAIMIKLTGEDADFYDVYYRVHAQSYGWLGWAKNGAPAGTAGYGKRLEGIQIVVVKKGASYNQKMEGITSVRTDAFVAKAGSSPIVNYSATSNTNPVVPGADDVNVAYRTHVQSFGWQGWKYNGQMSGTNGLAKRLEGIEINVTNKDYDGGIAYCTHVQTYAWQGAKLDDPTTWKQDGQMAGTSGEAKRLEAICITLTGEMAEHYDIYYRVHAQSYGWLGWAKNGNPAGTAGYGKRLEGIQIVVVPKGQAGPAKDYKGIVSSRTEGYISK